MIAALFVAKNGPYVGLPDVDAWTVERDARKYAGPWSVVAHPPCSRWCQLAHVVEARYGHAVGDDGGCFESALRSVRTYGGVLEHPAFSLAWPAFGLTAPQGSGWQRSFLDDSWTCEVSQRAYGHRAEKLTWLYYIGEAEPPPLNWARPPGEAIVSYMNNHGGRDLPRLSKREAAATPAPFCELLLSIAKGAA